MSLKLQNRFNGFPRSSGEIGAGFGKPLKRFSGGRVTDQPLAKARGE